MRRTRSTLARLRRPRPLRAPAGTAHGRFAQDAWTYDPEALEIYRAAALLHERLVPYVRAGAATAARTGLPVVRPLLLTDPADERGWILSDQYG